MNNEDHLDIERPDGSAASLSRVVNPDGSAISVAVANDAPQVNAGRLECGFSFAAMMEPAEE